MPEESIAGQSLKRLAEEKEQEWRHLQQLRVQSLESSLEQREGELSEQKMKFEKLKEDFKYNLRLLNERHAELDNYDKLVLELRSALSQRDGAISDMKIRVDELETAAARETVAREEMTRHYQQRVREKEAELQSYRAVKDTEVQEDRERLETSKRVTERRVLQLEEELAAQKQELSYGFEEAMRQREHEFRKQADEMSSSVLAHELKVKLLTKELEVVRAAAEKTTAEVTEADSHQRTLQKQLKHAQWELHDVTAMKDARISELQGKLDQTEKAMTRMQEDFARRHEELDKVLRQKEQCLAKVKESSHETEIQLSARIRDLEAAAEDSLLKVKQLEWTMEDLRKDKHSIIERLNSEMNDVRAKFDSRLSETVKDNSARDVELLTLKDSENKLRAELAQRKADIDRYKRELSSAVERQADLERGKAQLDLDWQHRYDDVERRQYERSEDLVKGLTKARDEALAESEEKQRELSHCEELIKALTADRNQALTVLRHHGIPLDHTHKGGGQVEQDKDGTEERVTDLLTQNENLRAVVRQMRREMETLGEEMPAKPPQPTADREGVNLVANEYVKNLETEIQELKSRLRKMQHDAKQAKTDLKPESDISAALVAAGDNMVIKSHVESLNNTIGALRREKTELVTQLRKQQTRIAHLESGLSQLSKQPLQKQVTIEQLQYELSSQQRRHQVEVAGLKARVGDLDLQLAETRKEADEYYKATIERNLETTALGNEVSKLKMALAEKRPTVNYGAQELMIQQLQDEIERLRRQQRGGPAGGQLPSEASRGPERWAEPGVTGELREKLRQAAKHISQLAREKKQLIEMGNRLRAQLYKAGVHTGEPGPSHVPVGPLTYVPAGHAVPGDTGSSGFPPASSGQLYGTDTETSGQSGVIAGLSEKMKNKLIQLEKQQYDLMKQKLAVEQREQFMSTGDTDVLSVSSGSVSLGPLGGGDETVEEPSEEEYRPPSILKKSGREPLVKLSPVPEDTVPTNRPRTAPSDFPRPDSALSDSFRPATSHSGRAAPPMLSMSSVGGESLAEVWKLLDEEGVSPRPFTPMHSGDGPFRGLQYPGDAYDRSGSSQSFTIRGSQPNYQPKPRAQPKPAVAQPVSQKKPGKKAGPKSKIRNYNVKD